MIPRHLYIGIHFVICAVSVSFAVIIVQQPVLSDSFKDFVGLQSIITASIVVSSMVGALLGRFLYHRVADAITARHAQEIRFLSRDVARLNPEGVRLEFGPYLIQFIFILPIVVMHYIMGYSQHDLFAVRLDALGFLFATPAVINYGRVPTLLNDISEDGLWRWRTMLSETRGDTLSFSHALGFGSGSFVVVRLHDADGSVIKSRRLDLSFRDRDAILAMTKRSGSG